jgi:hypothetical protein
MSIEGTQEYLQKIGTVLFGSAPDGWASVEAHMSAVGHVGQCLVYVTDGGHNTARIATPSKLSGHFMKLRRLMYHEGKGTWYTSTFKLQNSGSFNVDYDYDGEPSFLPPAPGPYEYQLDHQHFPRDEENIPEWLHRKLQEAEQGQ